jgi:DNA topoisomerase III
MIGCQHDRAAVSVALHSEEDLVARRFVAQFLPAFEFEETTIEIEIGAERVRARGRQIVAEGWCELVRATALADATTDESEDDPDHLHYIPSLREGARVNCDGVSLLEKQTKPPRRFTEASLIQAMTGIARFVDDPHIKQLLKETDGIGTPATQAQIIQTLFERHFIEKRGKQIQATAAWRALIAALPEVATRPDRTALWEAAMRRIVEGHVGLATFLATVAQEVGGLVKSAQALGRLEVPAAAGLTRKGTPVPLSKSTYRGGRARRGRRRRFI